MTITYGQKVKFVDLNNNPIEGVFVSSSQHTYGVLSERSGNANLSEFEEDEILTITHSSYATIRVRKGDLSDGQIITLRLKDVNLPEVYVRHPLRYFLVEDDEAGQIESIPQDIVRIENPPNSADMLQNTGFVAVQKSQGGGGSPIIRGFEANKLLLVVDGIRMNNAIYRSGHLQNSLTVDNTMLSKTEIIFGPSSALYGSDALGGVIHFHTMTPEPPHIDSSVFSGSSYLRFNSNNNSSSAHFDFTTGRKNWALLNSITASQFGDMRMGENRLHGYDSWGLHPDYVSTVDGVDTILANPDPNVQYGAGYTQMDFMEKFVYEPKDCLRFTFNLQYSTSSRINRYDKLVEYSGNGDLKYAEWYYGPQKRILGAAKVDFKADSKWMNHGTVILSYQRIDEDRISRRYKSSSRLSQLEDVNVFAVNADFNKIFTKSRMVFYGAEVQHNLVRSASYYEDIYTSDRTDAQTRYPGFSQYMNAGVYAEYKQKFRNGAVFSAGMRYSLIYANSDFSDTSFISLPFNDVSFLTSAPSGHVGLVLKPDTLTHIRMMATSGFRAPNVDDYGKVFEKSGNTVVPNDHLKPEYAVGGEFSVQRTFGKDFITIGGTVYGTYLFNAMVKKDFTLNGQDSILYDGEMTKIQTIMNVDEAVIYGTSAFLELNFTRHLGFSYSHNYTVGKDISNKTPLGHIAPQFGKISFHFNNGKLNTAVYSFYNFRKELGDYSASGEDNLDQTPNEDGTPPWWTLNFRLSYSFFDLFTAQIMVENILDVHYRTFASGVSAPGRNFMVGIRADF